MMAAPRVEHGVVLSLFIHAAEFSPGEHSERGRLVDELANAVAASGVKAEVGGDMLLDGTQGLVGAAFQPGHSIRLASTEPGADGVSRTAAMYRHHDALVIRLGAVRAGKAWSLVDGCRGLAEEVLANVDAAAVRDASADVLGATLFYWATGDFDSHGVEDQVRRLTGHAAPRHAATDIGSLWLAHSTVFEGLADDEVPQDRWVLLSEPNDHPVVHRRYVGEDGGRTPFVVVSLARHKAKFEAIENESARKLSDESRARLEARIAVLKGARQAMWESMGNRVAAEGDETQRLMRDLQHAITDAAEAAADLHVVVAERRALLRTVAISHANFVANAPALLLQQPSADVRMSIDQGTASAAALDGRQDDLFAPEASRIQHLLVQLKADLEYLDLDLKRYDIHEHAALMHHQVALVDHQAEFMRNQLRTEVDSDDNLQEMARLHGVEAATVVATLVGFITAEVLKMGGDANSVASKNMLLGFNWVVFSVCASFALVRRLARGRHRDTWLERGSVAFAVGSSVGVVTAFGIPGEDWRLNLIVSAVVAAVVYCVRSARKKAPARGTRRRSRDDPVVL